MDWLIGALAAFAIAVVTTPVGVSGAVFLLPLQLSVLHVPSPALTPTNLLYNVFATPGAIARYRRRGRRADRLTLWLLAGTLPGVVLGAVARVELIDGPEAFLGVVALVLAPIGAWLLLGRAPADDAPAPAPGWPITALAFGAGLIGGVYGIGGGSLIGPALAVMGFSLYAVAPAALTCTFVTSVAGVITYQAIQLTNGDGTIAPDWGLGLAMGAGGLLGGIVGAQLQPRLPETALRKLLGLCCIALAIRYAAQAL
jgi:uncharacterized membrane protein YfcA